MTKKKVLVTGAAGFLAAFIIRRLHAGYDLTLTDRVAPGIEFADFSFTAADITDYEAIERLCARQDARIDYKHRVGCSPSRHLYCFPPSYCYGPGNPPDAYPRPVD